MNHGKVSGELGFVRLNPRKKTPLFEQLYAALQSAILDGTLASESKLPSSRDLVEQLGVSRTTVTAAMDRLLAEGYVYTIRGSGTFVCSSLPQELRDIWKGKQSESQDELGVPEHNGEVFATNQVSEFGGNIHRLEDVAWFSADPVAFCPGEPALDEFPTELWRQLLRRVWKKLSPRKLSYGDTSGYRPLRQAIARHVVVHRGVTCDWTQVFVVGGTQQAVDLVARLLLNPGDSVLFENPGYSNARASFEALGCSIEPMQVDEMGAMLPNESHADLAYVTPSHQYPTGVTMPIERRLEFLSWASDRQRWLIEDDYDSEYRYGQHTIPAMQGLDRSGRTFYVGSFSKVICPALSLGYLVVPRTFSATVDRALRLTSRSPSTMDQIVLSEFLRQGHFGRHLRRMRKTHARRRQVFVELMQTQLDSKLELIGSPAGLHCTALLRDHRSDVEVSRRLEQGGIIARPLSRYYASQTPEHDRKQGLVLGFACATPAQIRQGVRVMAETLFRSD